MTNKTFTLPESALLHTVTDDCMQPTLCLGDAFACDYEQTGSDGLYFIEGAGIAGVRRVSMLADGMAMVWGDNPRYPAKEVCLQALKTLAQVTHFIKRA
ncbi:MAG: hypothetical protein KDI44_06115 [Thiothrix sp.]|nr:hypothetical protein [Thiothrix sp.]HPQ95192.1 hypothetical protein [Thiolinea sp.]